MTPKSEIEDTYAEAFAGIFCRVIVTADDERTLRSVANATYQDGIEFMQLADEIPFEISIQKYALRDANQALLDLKHSRIDGAGVLII
ncbi:MAG: hypothetical protein P8Z42_10355 [Anaerolineales bacterium]